MQVRNNEVDMECIADGGSCGLGGYCDICPHTKQRVDMEDLLDKMREVVNEDDVCLKSLINIVREHDYENHEVLQVWKKDIIADERERCIQIAEDKRLVDGTKFTDDYSYNLVIDHVIEAIRNKQRNNGGDMTLQDKITQMIFDRFGRTDRDLAYRIEKEARADERERCVNRANQVSYFSCEHALASDKHAYESGRDAIIEAIKAE